jgi:hypothetical protein
LLFYKDFAAMLLTMVWSGLHFYKDLAATLPFVEWKNIMYHLNSGETVISLHKNRKNPRQLLEQTYAA